MNASPSGHRRGLPLGHGASGFLELTGVCYALIHFMIAEPSHSALHVGFVRIPVREGPVIGAASNAYAASVTTLWHGARVRWGRKRLSLIQMVPLTHVKNEREKKGA